MSASVAPSTPVPVPTTAPPQTNNNNNEWLLPMPISGTADSFAQELIDQFDKRHSKLRQELVQVQVSNQHRNNSSLVTDDSTHQSTRQSSIGSIGSSNTSHHNNNTSAAHYRGNSNGKGKTLIVPPNQQHPLQQQQQQQQSRSLTKTPIRSRSAGDLLRQSSAYLRAKFKAVLADHDSDDDDIQDDDDDDPIDAPDVVHWPIPSSNPYPPSKIAINTTISIPRRPPVHYAMIQPPVITQYPPKPLKYSPVEPLDEEGLPDPTTASSNTPEHEQAIENIGEQVTEEQNRKTRRKIWSRGLENSNHDGQQQRNALLHRISLPVLTRATFHQERLSNNNPVGKRKWFFCRPWKRSRKGKERA